MGSGTIRKEMSYHDFDILLCNIRAPKFFTATSYKQNTNKSEANDLLAVNQQHAHTSAANMERE